MDKIMSRMITLLSRKMQPHLQKTLTGHNITVAEQPFFGTLQHYDGVTQEDLTEMLKFDKAATARAVQSLEKKGLVTRTRDKNDKRKNRLYLTEEAKKRWPAVRNDLSHFNERLIWGIDARSLEITYQVLQKMEENLVDMKSDASMKGEKPTA